MSNKQNRSFISSTTMAVISFSQLFAPLSLLLLLFLLSFFSPSNAESIAAVPSASTPLLSPSPTPGAPGDHQLKLEYDYYRNSCPRAERIVYLAMRDLLAEDSKITARLLRLMFHDCFIQGCDASLLLDDSNGNQSRPIERNAIPNQTIKGFEAIDRIKEVLEVECPGTVSCSDIISLATRNAIVLSNGPFFPVLTGRKDSLVSHHDDANRQIPSPESNIDDTLDRFSQRGFNEKEVVSLLGAHNIGQIGCEFILKRLSNFQDSGMPDPTIPADFVLQLSVLCNTTESPSPSPSTLRSLMESTSGLSNFQSLVPFVSSGSGFDTHYFKSLVLGRGLLYADQQLMARKETARIVRMFASDDGSYFRKEFAKAMLKMSNLQGPVASQGEVRTRCSRPNSNAVMSFNSNTGFF